MCTISDTTEEEPQTCVRLATDPREKPEYRASQDDRITSRAYTTLLRNGGCGAGGRGRARGCTLLNNRCLDTGNLTLVVQPPRGTSRQENAVHDTGKARCVERLASHTGHVVGAQDPTELDRLGPTKQGQLILTARRNETTTEHNLSDV